MRALLQRVTRAAVRIEGETVGAIGLGWVVLLGVGIGDTAEIADRIAEKAATLRAFSDEQGKMNLAAVDVGAEFLVVSQFTLYADVRKGRRPSFIRAAPPEVADPLVTRFVERLRALGFTVQTGRFGARMLVEIHNDGPVTIWLDSAELF